MEKHLLPARERLIWIPICLSVLSFVYGAAVVLLHPFFQEYSYAYILRGKGMKFFIALVILTFFAIGGHLYVRWLGKHIVEAGTYHSGQITRVIWKRALLNWCEWKCQLVVTDQNGTEYTTPAYRYEFLNYLYGTACEVYTWGRHCYAKGFQTADRQMTKEEKRAGETGGKHTRHNQTPDFPILRRVEVVHRYRMKHSYRAVSERVILGYLVFMFMLYCMLAWFQVYETSPGDSDGDGMWDSDELYTYGTDPLVYDALFRYTRSDAAERYRVSVEVTAPYQENRYGFSVRCISPQSHEDAIPGYVDQPFEIYRIPKQGTEAVLTVEFDETLLQKGGFVPGIGRSSYDHQEEGMVWLPTVWDGESNVVSVDLLSEGAEAYDAMSEGGWRYFLLDKREWDTWMKEYEEYWRNR